MYNYLVILGFAFRASYKKLVEELRDEIKRILFHVSFEIKKQ